MGMGAQEQNPSRGCRFLGRSRCGSALNLGFPWERRGVTGPNSWKTAQ